MNRLLLIGLCFVSLQLSSCRESNIKEYNDFPGIAKQQYVPGTEDVPVYFGFAISNEDNVSYDTIDGRIIDATFYSENASIINVQKFYDVTLPQLGWNKDKSQQYERDGEILKLTISKKPGKVLLKFVIRPVIY